VKRGPFLWIVPILLVATLGAGCSGERSSVVPSDEPPAAQRDPTVQYGEKATIVPTLEPQEEKAEEGEVVTPTPTPQATEAELPARAEELVAIARVDLARRLDLAPEAIRTVSVEAVEWPDASLGCPQPGMMYAQVITPGFRVILEAQGEVYEYHTDRAQMVILCEEEPMMEDPEMAREVEPGLEPLVNQAKEDLAQRLSISVDQIAVLEARSVVWPNAALGCPQPGMKYRQVPMDGALIRLAVDGKVYEYHSGGGRDPFLCEQPLKLEKDAQSQIDLLKLTPPSPDQ
jgi:hypothetical protein